MDADLVQRDLLLHHPLSPPSPTSAWAAASSSSILQSLPLHVSFDRGFYLLVKAIQELRERKDGVVVTVGIGGPTGSGKTTLAEKVASVLGCVVIVSMEDYRTGGGDDGSDVDAIDFDALARNLQMLRVRLSVSNSGAGVRFGKFFWDTADNTWNPTRVSESDTDAGCLTRQKILDTGVRVIQDLVKGKDTMMPLVDFQEKKRTGWRKLKISTSGVVIVDGAYALHSTLRSLLDIRVAVVGGVHFSLLSKVQHDIGDSCSLDYLIDSIFPLFRKHIEPDLHHAQIRIDNSFVCSFHEPYYKLKCKNEIVAAEASELGMKGPWITKSYLEMILESKGVPQLNTPPPVSSTLLTVSQEKKIAAPKPICVSTDNIANLDDLVQPWTRSPPKKLEQEHVLAKWQFIPDSSRNSIQLAPLPDSYDLDRGLLLSVQAIQALLENKGFPVIVGIGDPSGSGKTSLAQKMANIIGCEVVSLESYYKPEQVRDYKYDDYSSLDIALLTKNIMEIRNSHKAEVPCFDFENFSRDGFKEVNVSEESGVVIFEGVYTLHPAIRKLLDFWIAVVGGVHSHLIARIQRDKNRAGFSISQNEIMTTVFPLFQQYIEPHLVHAHLKIQNDFDPVLSPESSLFVLKSKKQVSYQDILKVLDATKVCSSVQNFTDVYLRLPGVPLNGQLTEGECIRVRICEGRFALLIREPIREGNFIIQPKVDFDISASTVAGLLKLGYHAVAYIEASAVIYQDGKILIEVDHLQGVATPYLQIKGTNKDIVSSAASALSLNGSYTTKSYLQIILESLPGDDNVSAGIHNQQAARLQELVEFIQSQGGNINSDSSSPMREISSSDSVLDDMQSRIRKLERWNTINMVLWTILLSALVGYSLYQKRRH